MSNMMQFTMIYSISQYRCMRNTILKYAEATYFFNQMIILFIEKHTPEMEFNLNAFLVASKSILEYLYYEKIVDEHIKEYGEMLKEFNKNNSEFIKLRNSGVHVNNVSKGASAFTDFVKPIPKDKKVVSVLDSRDPEDIKIVSYLESRDGYRELLPAEYYKSEINITVTSKGKIDNCKHVFNTEFNNKGRFIKEELENRKYINKYGVITSRFTGNRKDFNLSDLVSDEEKWGVFNLINSYRLSYKINEFFILCQKMLEELYEILGFFVLKQDKELSEENLELLNSPAVRIWYSNLGVAFNKLEDFDNAILAFSNQINVDTTNNDAYFKRGYTYYLIKNFSKAYDDFEKSLAINPTNSSALYFSAMSKYFQEPKDYSFILRKLAQAISYSKNDKNLQREHIQYYCSIYNEANRLGVVDTKEENAYYNKVVNGKKE